MFKLCFKSYDWKMSQGAIKKFKQDTGACLSYTLSCIAERWSDSTGLDQRKRLNSVMSVCDREKAAYVFFHLCNGSGGNVPIEEFEDSIHRVGDFPNSLDDEWSYPWPIVLVKLIKDIEDYDRSNRPTKKTVTSE
jgi:hypothetical protein